ncbi:MAG: hypothetical protein ABID67_02480 [Candidatus Nealsonbacteria bacterium]
MNILSIIKRFVNKYLDDIMLVIGVILISLISFFIGYIVAREEMKPPMEFEEIQYEENESSYNRSRNIGT